LRDLFIYDGLTNKADLIKMTQIQTRTHMHQISEMLAIAAITLLLIHIADGSVERVIKHGFLPVSIDKRPFGISNFGILGGALIGTTALGVSVMDMDKGISTILTVCAIGYVIMGSGILLRAIQRRRIIFKIV
jgi:hypothetical protein